MAVVGGVGGMLFRADDGVAVALVTGQLSKEIAEVGGEIEGLFGVLDEEMLKLE